MGIGETICRSLAKHVMRAAGDQVKTTCGNLQLCAGLEAVIEGETHAMVQSRLARLRARQIEEEVRRTDEEESESKEAGDKRLRTVTAGTEEEAAERLGEALEMEVKEEGEGEGEEEVDVTQRALGALEFLIQ